EDDLRLLEVLAGHAAVVLENARLYEAMRREVLNAKAWLEFADALSRADGIEAMCCETVSRVAGLLLLEQSSLWLQDRRSGEFYCAAAHGYEAGGGGEEIVGRRVEREAGQRFLGEPKPPFGTTG